MNRDLINKMIKTKRLELSFWQKVNHYSIIGFFLLFPLYSLITLLEIYITNTYDGVRTADEILRVSLPWIIPAIVFYFIQKERLQLKKIVIDYTDEEFKEAVSRTKKELEWDIEKNNKSHLVAHRPWNWTGSWGELITIIKLKDGILINSICDPDKWGSVISYGWNRKNIRTFLRHLTDTKQGIPLTEKIEKLESEWTLRRIALRFLMYPLSLLLITAGLFAIYCLTLQGIIIGILVILPVSLWIYADTKLIIKQKKAQKQDKS